jgi:hypothetical protein
MPSPALPLAVPDVSAFARSLGRSLHERHRDRLDPPSHVELLNLIARAAGHRNFQALRAAPPPMLEPPAPDDGYADALDPPDGGDGAPAAPLSENARKALGHFDRHGRLMRWPVKFSVQKLAMWVLWTRFEAKRPYTEREVNAILREANGFGDHVTLRRELINHQLLTRKSDCSEYRKLPARPDEETRLLLTAARARFRSARAPRRRTTQLAANPD